MTPDLHAEVARLSNNLATAWCDIMGSNALHYLCRDPLGKVALNMFSDFAHVEDREQRKRALQQCAKWIKRDVIPTLKKAPVDSGKKVA